MMVARFIISARQSSNCRTGARVERPTLVSGSHSSWTGSRSEAGRRSHLAFTGKEPKAVVTPEASRYRGDGHRMTASLIVLDPRAFDQGGRFAGPVYLGDARREADQVLAAEAGAQ